MMTNNPMMASNPTTTTTTSNPTTTTTNNPTTTTTNEQSNDDDDDEQSNDDDDEQSNNDDEQSNNNDDVQSNDDERQFDGEEEINFAEDDYESSITNLLSLVTYFNHESIREVWRVTTIEQNKEHFVIICDNANHLCTCMLLVSKGLVCRHFFSVMTNSDEAMFHIGLIPDRWYNEKSSNFQKEPAITVCSKKREPDGVNPVEPVYEHQVGPNFDLLHDIRHTQAFSENAKQNLSRQAKYNQGFGYAKRAVGLALEIGCEDELNGLLQSWISEKQNEIRDSNIENLPNVSNPYRTRTKGAPRKKHVKNALEENQDQKQKQNSSGKYTCSYCKGRGHNARRCELKKKKLKKSKSK
jgi:hypothetical protein